ncbi:MAG: hypothetical protein V3U84_00130 [Thiotrichaceae bacterium]
MFKKIAYTLAFIGALGSVAAVAANKAQSPLSSEMKAFVVQKDATGKEKLMAVKSAEPGQTIQYQLTYQNKGKGALKGLTVTGPVPANTHFLGKSTHTKVKADLVVSIDGGKTYEKEPVKRMKAQADGSKKMVVIPADKYTHVRWKTKSALQSGSKQVFNYRVKVN